MGMFKGKIHWFDSRKKYGYVIDGYGNEYFYHANGIKKGRQIVTQGFEPDDEVEFDLVDGEKGKMATNLEIIGDVKPVHKKHDKKKDGSSKKNSPNNQITKALEKAGYKVGDSPEEADTKVEVSTVQQESTPTE